jgi:putative glutamine amidotransferase
VKWLLTAAESESPVLPAYRDWVHGAGIATEVIRPSQPIPSVEEFDALLLTGGGDIDPIRYGQAAHVLTSSIQPDRDDMEFRLLERFLESQRTVFGICRGLQVIQVFLGGRLIQHVPDLVASEMELHARSGNEDAIHLLTWQTNRPMTEVLGGLAGDCNSSHHQAADPSALARGLAVSATSACGIVEALESLGNNGSFVSCVQWHPERMKFDHPASGALRAYWVERVRRGVGGARST